MDRRLRLDKQVMDSMQAHGAEGVRSLYLTIFRFALKVAQIASSIYNLILAFFSDVLGSD